MAAVDEPVVDLIADDEQVVALGDGRQGAQALGLEHRARWGCWESR